VKFVAFLIALLFPQPPASSLQTPVAPLANVRSTLRQLRDQLDEHRPTFGATADLTGAKHQLRDWVETKIGALGENVDIRAFTDDLHNGLAAAGLFCNDFQDECYSNLLGYVDEIRVARDRDFLIVTTPVGINCGFDESAYVYAWNAGRWRRVWKHEQNTYAQADYLPQTIHDVQVSAADGSGRRLLLLLGSQSVCGGSFKDLYARVWQLKADYSADQIVNWSEHANDGYPPIRGRVLPDDVLFEFISGGIMSGASHKSVRHFKVAAGTATQVDPIAARAHDFVVEWIAMPWERSLKWSASPSLQAAHAAVHRTDGVGDFAEPTLRCAGDGDEWQVGLNMFEGPKRYYRVRSKAPLTYTMAAVSETPYPDCTMADPRAEIEPNVLSDVR
jgi:hypothetical protein